MAVCLAHYIIRGSGLLDTMIKYVQQSYLNKSNGNDFLVMAFVSALFSARYYCCGSAYRPAKLNFRSVLAGIAIGLPIIFLSGVWWRR